MSTHSPDDELLSILLRNLRNTAATFGEGSQPYNSTLSVIQQHLQGLQARGQQTNVTGARQAQSQVLALASEGTQQKPSAELLALALQELELRS